MTEPTDSRVKVARDLTEIVNMSALLDDQAEHKANATIDGTGLPGGMAMVSLAPVANLEAWTNRFDAAGRKQQDLMVEDEDPDWEPVLQTLCFWSEDWRRENHAEWGARPTVASEAAFIRWALDWAWENELRWDDFCADIRKARVRMENVMYAGDRPERGAPCLYEECRGARLLRKMEPTRDEDGHKVWRQSDWFCPRCHRRWDNDRYVANVAAAAWNAQAEVIDGETWCSAKYAARQVGRPEVTVRSWVSKGLFATACIIAGRRATFVRLSDVQRRASDSSRRGNAA